MAKGFDELITFLLEEIALCGEQGTSVEEIIGYIFTFYNDPEIGVQESGLSTQGRGEGSELCQSQQFSIDRPFLECAWRWLTSHPDVFVGKEKQGNGLTLSEIERLPTEREHQTLVHDDAFPQKEAPRNAQRGQEEPLVTVRETPGERPEQLQPQPRLYVSQERMWYALAGHGIDWKRLPYLEFVILSLIGASKRKAITQPQLVKLSGQDKRSVPKRTAALVTKGYIEKASILAGGSHTSLCILKKFAGSHESFRIGKGRAVKKESEPTSNSSEMSSPDIDRIVHGILGSFRDHAIVTRDEIKRLQGIPDSQAHRRVFFRVLRELEEMNIIRHVRCSYPNSANPKSFCTSIKLLREPEQSEVLALIESAPSLVLAMYDPNMDGISDYVFSGSVDEGGPGISFRNLDDDGQVLDIGDDEKQLVERKRNLPYWSPSQPLTNMLFDVTNLSGLDGANTMVLKTKGMGQFFLRPLEQLLDRLSERWQLAQPSHVRHLALIRDTEQLSSISCYKYFTHENFARLVQMGNAAWEAVGVHPPKNPDGTLMDPFDNGKHSFSVLPAGKFVGNGDKSLSECLRAAKIPFYLTRLDAVLEESEDGKYSLNWSGRKADGTRSVPFGRPRKSLGPQDLTEEIDPDVPRKRLGRPRKYAKGEEPYSKEYKARMRAEKKAAAEALAKGGADSPAETETPIIASDAGVESELQEPMNGQDDAEKTSQNVEEEVPSPPSLSHRTRSSDAKPSGPRTDERDEVDTSNLASPTPKNVEGSPPANDDASRARTTHKTRQVSQFSEPGLYINPPGSAPPKATGRGRPRRTCVLVFKSRKLRDLEWFRKSEKTVRFATPMATNERTASPQTPLEPENVNGKRVRDSATPNAEPPKRRRGCPPKVRHSDQFLQNLEKSPAPAVTNEVPSSPTLTSTPLNKPLSIADFIHLGSLATTLQSRNGAWNKNEGSDDLVSSVTVRSSRSAPEMSEPSPKRRKIVKTTALADSSPRRRGRPPKRRASQNLERRQTSPSTNANAGLQTARHTPFESERAAESDPAEQQSVEDGTGEQTIEGTQSDLPELSINGEAPLNNDQEPQPIEYESGSLPKLLEERPAPSVAIDASKITLGGGTIGFQRSKIILEILDKCGGAYPGNIEIVYPFFTAWMQLGRAEPDRLTVQKAVKNLVDSGKVKKLTFVFRDKKGGMATKAILIKPEVSPNSPVVRTIQERMIEAEPWLHLPEGAEIAEKYQKRVIPSTRQIAMRQISEKTRTGAKTQSRKEQQRGNIWRVNNGFSGEYEDQMRSQIEALEASVNADQGALAQKMAQLEALKRNMAFGSPSSTPTPQGHSPQHSTARGNSRLYRLQRPPQPIAPRPLEHGNGEQALPIDPALLQETPQDAQYPLPSTIQFDNAHQPYYLPPRGSSTSSYPTPSYAPSHANGSGISGPDAFTGDSGNRQPTFTEQLASIHRERKRRSLMDPSLRVATLHAQSEGNILGKRPLPTSLEDILERYVKRRRRTNPPPSMPPWRKFVREIESVQSWEIENPFLIDQRQDGWHFINHTLPEQENIVDVAEPIRKFHIIFCNVRPDTGLTEVGSDGEKPASPTDVLGLGELVGEGGRMLPPSSSARSSRKRRQLTTRRLTSLAEKAAYDAQVNHVVLDESERPAKARRVRGPNSETALTTEMEHKLLVAVVVVRTLTGGLERNIDWIIVSRIFEPVYPQRFIQQRWAALQTKYRLHIDKLQLEFQEAFAQAYEEDLVPRIDFDNLQAYDWPWLVSWTQRTLDLHSMQGPPELPDTRERLEDMFEVRELPDNASIWREEFTSLNVTMLKRTSTLKSVPLALPIVFTNSTKKDKENEVATQSSKRDEGMHSLARSWVRANIFTYPDIYNPQKAREKFLGISSDFLDKAVSSLLQEKAIVEANKGRVVPGRNYDISDHFLKSSRKSLEENHFVRAVAFKNTLDQAFADKGFIDFSYHAEDGDVLAVINLVANGRVKLTPKNPPMNKFGLTDGGYRTRFMQKSRLIFDVEVRPSATYIPGLPLEPLPSPAMDEFEYQYRMSDFRNDGDAEHGQEPIQALPQQKRIPFWVDIHDNFNPVMWRLALAAVLSIMALRPGISVRQLHTATRPCFDEWELHLLLEWLVVAKAVKKIVVGEDAVVRNNDIPIDVDATGYAPEEWWWTVLRPETGIASHPTHPTRAGQNPAPAEQVASPASNRHDQPVAAS